jgi:hypothetical protein
MREFTEEMGFLPVAEGNHLVATDLKNTQRKGMDKDDDYFDEVNPEGDVIAKYYTWHHMSIYPPQKIISEGWIKFDLEDNKIASGSR